MKRKQVVISLLCVAVLALSGCQSQKNAPDSSQETVDAASDPSADSSVSEEAAAGNTEDVSSSETEDETGMYNAYIDVYNIISGEMNDAVNGYFDHVPYQEEFTRVEESDYWCYQVSEYDLEVLDSTYALIDAKADKDDIDTAFLNMYPVMKDLGLAINEVEEYTDMKSFIDDDYAKGAELHTRIYDDYQKYEPLCLAYQEVAEPFFEEENAKDLEEMKAQGYEMTYALNVAINTAQEIQDMIYASGVTDENIIELDTTAIKPIYDRYVTEIETCMELSGDPEKMGEDAYLADSVYLDQCLESLKDSKVALNGIFQRVTDQEPVDSFDLGSAFAADGTIGKFEETVSAAIDNYNYME